MGLVGWDLPEGVLEGWQGRPARPEARLGLEKLLPRWQLTWPWVGGPGALHTGLPTGLLSVLQRGGQCPPPRW